MPTMIFAGYRIARELEERQDENGSLVPKLHGPAGFRASRAIVRRKKGSKIMQLAEQGIRMTREIQACACAALFAFGGAAEAKDLGPCATPAEVTAIQVSAVQQE